jgi:membrane protease YdiL (CAAX protease family)
MFTKYLYKPVIILLYTVLAASFWKYFAIPINDFGEGWTRSFCIGTYPLIGALILFGLIPMGIVKWCFHENLADYGLRLGILYRTIRSFVIAAPIVVIIAVLTGHNSAFFDVYPLNEAIRPQNVRISFGVFAVHAVLYFGYYFGWEFLFRGFIQHGLTERCGILTAILVQTLASTMLHYGHPASEVFGSILAGLIWGTFAYRTQSILSGLGQHALLGIVLDAVLITRN